MARPRRGVQGPDARQRLIEAFWELLARMPFDDITIGALARTANVSPNTLYYHFNGIPGIARASVSAELSEAMARKLLGGVTGEGLSPLLEDSRDALRLSRVGLIASSGSAKLTSMLVAMLKAAWCDLSGRTPESLTETESMDLDFIYGGLVAVLADPTVRGDVRKLECFLARPLGKGVAGAMAELFSV